MRVENWAGLAEKKKVTTAVSSEVAGGRDITEFYFLDAARWRMRDASWQGGEAVREQRQLIREDVAAWLDEFAFNMPTRFGYAIGYVEGDLKVVRRHPVHDAGLEVCVLLREREDMRLSYQRAKDYVSEKLRYREHINEEVFGYLVQERFLRTAEDEVVVWMSPPPARNRASREAGYGRSTHTSLFRVAREKDVCLVDGVTAISELPLWQTARFGRRIVESGDESHTKVRRLWHPFLRDRDLLEVPFGVRMESFSQSWGMVNLAHHFAKKMYEESRSMLGSSNVLARQEALLYEQELAMMVVPQVHVRMASKYERFIDGLASGMSDEDLKVMLRELWREGAAVYVDLMRQAESDRGGDGERMSVWLNSAVNARKEGRGCPTMSKRSETEVTRLRYDESRDVFVDDDGQEYRNAEVVCKHCKKRQSVIGQDERKGGFFLKKVCEDCGKSPCDD